MKKQINKILEDGFYLGKKHENLRNEIINDENTPKELKDGLIKLKEEFDQQKNSVTKECNLIPFSKLGITKMYNDGNFEIELLDIDLKWSEDCSDEEIEEFRKKGYVVKTNSNYDKKLEKLKLKLRSSLYESNVNYEKKPYFIKGLNLPYKTKNGDYEPHIYNHHFNDLFFCKEIVDEVDSRNPDDWIYYPIGMFLDHKIFMDIESEYSYQDIINFLDWFENYLKRKYKFVGDKILFGNKIVKIEEIFKIYEN